MYRYKGELRLLNYMLCEVCGFRCGFMISFDFVLD